MKIRAIVGASLFAAFLMANSSVAGQPQPDPHVQRINISVACLGGPSFDEEVQNSVNILQHIKHKILDIKVTSRNGYGKACAGYILHRPTIIPPSPASVIYQDVSIDCMWGNVYRQAAQLINYAELSGKSTYYFDITSRNGYGKACAAKLGFY